jgi:hypothetical protein
MSMDEFLGNGKPVSSDSEQSATKTAELIECAWCDEKATPDDICPDCAGCPQCCSESAHCAYCKKPFGVCMCADRDGPLNSQN